MISEKIPDLAEFPIGIHAQTTGSGQKLVVVRDRKALPGKRSLGVYPNGLDIIRQPLLGEIRKICPAIVIDPGAEFEHFAAELARFHAETKVKDITGAKKKFLKKVTTPPERTRTYGDLMQTLGIDLDKVDERYLSEPLSAISYGIIAQGLPNNRVWFNRKEGDEQREVFFLGQVALPRNVYNEYLRIIRDNPTSVREIAKISLNAVGATIRPNYTEIDKSAERRGSGLVVVNESNTISQI